MGNGKFYLNLAFRKGREFQTDFIRDGGPTSTASRPSFKRPVICWLGMIWNQFCAQSGNERGNREMHQGGRLLSISLQVGGGREGRIGGQQEEGKREKTIYWYG